MFSWIGRSLGNININGKRLVSDSGHLHKKVCLSGEVRIPHARVKTSNGDTVTEEKKVEKIDPKLCSKYPELFEPHTFAPKDLLALLKNLEHEISICETSLKDENDKRNKYKVIPNLECCNFFQTSSNKIIIQHCFSDWRLS